MAAAWIATVAGAGPAQAAQRCTLPGAQFIAKSAQAQLFSVAVKGRGAVKRRYFGCRTGHKPLLLTQDIVAKTEEDTAYTNTMFRIGGTWAGWVETTASAAGVGQFSRAIHLRSLAGVKRQVDVFTTTDVASFGSVAAFKVGSDGAMAFLLKGSGGAVEVDGVAHDAGLPVALAYGRDIAGDTLLLGHGQVTFTQAGRSRTVLLAEPAPVPTGNAAGPQGLDGRFGDCGTLVPATVKPNLATGATSLAQAPGGMIVAAGTTTSGKGDSLRADRLVVTRFDAGGHFDQAFGTGGAVIAPAPRPAGGGDVDVSGVAVQADGRIVVSENAQAADPSRLEPVLLRYDATGRLDPGFGSAGVVRAAVPATTAADINEIAIAPDGGIIAAGRRDNRWFVARFRTDGTLDPAFGTRGLVTDPGGEDSGANSVAVTADGTIVMAGGINGRPLLARFSPTGVLLGATTDAPPAAATLSALAVLPDGSFAAAGTATNIEGANQLLLAHYAADGSLDHAFGSAGWAIDREVDGARDIAADAEGHWLVTAPFSFSGDGVIRYTATGARDAAFGFRGAVGGITSYGMTDSDILAGPDGTALVAQANGLAFAVSRFAITGAALRATAGEPSVCAMLVSSKKPGPLAATRKLPVGLRLRKPGKVHLHATVTVGARTVTLGDTTFSRSEDEAAVATIPITKAAAALMRTATKVRITIAGGAPGGPVRRYSVTVG